MLRAPHFSLSAPVTSAHVGGINSGGYEWGSEGYFIRRIKLRPMSSICFSPSSPFPRPPLVLLLLSSFSFSHRAIYRLTSGVAALRRDLGRKTLPRVAVSFFRLSQEDLSLPCRTCEVLSRSCRRILDTTRLGVFSRDHSPPHPSVCLGDMQCTMQYRAFRGNF